MRRSGDTFSISHVKDYKEYYLGDFVLWSYTSVNVNVLFVELRLVRFASSIWRWCSRLYLDADIYKHPGSW